MGAGSVTSPRPAPEVLLPAIGGAAALALALPVYLVAGWVNSNAGSNVIAAWPEWG